jgi:hypothetical protein
VTEQFQERGASFDMRAIVASWVAICFDDDEALYCDPAQRIRHGLAALTDAGCETETVVAFMANLLASSFQFVGELVDEDPAELLRDGLLADGEPIDRA